MSLDTEKTLQGTFQHVLNGDVARDRDAYWGVWRGEASANFGEWLGERRAARMTT